MSLPRDIRWLRKDAEYFRLERETCTYEWRGTEDQQWREGRKACIDRRKTWGQDDCEERGSDRGTCAECRQDIAEALETKASKQRRADACAAMRARATALRAENRQRKSGAAKAIEARRAETGTGSVHESAVPQAFAQNIPGDSA
ncbi:hypothetical protein EDF56_101190 [Novosphingobium sp. PhB165]|uniref:hypothetical protein n=1 Tax=Novosphingobium sp. PhB165 TaxID=2485105 RepID=UPI001042BAD2|nr:hypothetical protein [Novosphingobium sp. PhB165]TCM21526.1 hypothetical protein EDF56_101190 [Novosphingobium sp. PhB165]